MSSSETAVELKVFVGVNTVITRFAKKEYEVCPECEEGMLVRRRKYGSF